MRTAVRVIAFVVVLVMGGGSAALDGCLVSCQTAVGVKNTRPTHCHTTPLSPRTGLRLQAIARCCHDVTTGVSDTIVRSKVLAGALHAVNGSVVDRPADFAPTLRLVLDRHAAYGQLFEPLQTPLRL